MKILLTKSKLLLWYLISKDTQINNKIDEAIKMKTEVVDNNLKNN